MIRTRFDSQPSIRESEIEEVFVAYPDLLQNVLETDVELRLIVRQLSLPSGRLDLLLLGGVELFLVELKVTPYDQDHLRQITSYREDLREQQRQGKLARGTINPILLVTQHRPSDVEECLQAEVILRTYSPDSVLEAYYMRTSSNSGFLTVKPMDYGVWNLHLINRAVGLLIKEQNLNKIAQQADLAVSTVRNHLRFAAQLGLVRRQTRAYQLTELGEVFVEAQDPVLSDWSLSTRQAALLRERILKDPFASPTIFGIFAIVESVFVLSRNTYPIEFEKLVEFYREFVGKRYDWKTKRSAFLGCSAFSHFAADLGLIARVNDKVLLTPSGYRFTLLMQLHKGIQMVDAIQRPQ